ncbi:type II toxin-antitoxin system HicA family toxin [uncultured Gemmiger sp.]|uniref:type II toxin-antitoxin system HicA family toxin n=1 Tax=uncultured Gemmiger sp. TaxID=1623490 RepID=UPI0025D444DA|nr:type II toxin-antitoxin system HicA family toxin [uncultured Gemmiger sp.]
MSKVENLIAKLCSTPTPADFRYSDVKKIMAYYGYVESNKGATSGSRVKFYSPKTGAIISLHKPHPGDQMVRGAVRDVVEFLRKQGHIE